jgi:hypothetical protein
MAVGRRVGVALILGVLAFVCARAGAQVVRTTTSDRPVSPTVVASWLVRDNHLTLLVLWRGTPGWFWRKDGSSGGGGGGDGHLATQQIRYGDYAFAMSYDFDRQTAAVAGQELSLRDTNVVMVDFVDSVGGPTVVDMRRVAPELPADVDSGLIVIGREPDLYPFLRCDAPWPGMPGPIALAQQMIASICSRLRPR